MTDKTPIRNSTSETRFIQLKVHQSPAAGSPQNNLTGPPRIARDLAADLYNNIQRWNDLHIKGAQIVKRIAILKSDEPRKYSPQLEECTTDLYRIFQAFTTCKANFESVKTQIVALGKLQKNCEPLFISYDMAGLVLVFHYISDAYLEEYKVKEMVLENIAHSRNKDEVMFFASCWTLQINITSFVAMKLEALLVETGHRNFS